jgi:HlyD family type I secretion membrane fusion protein
MIPTGLSAKRQIFSGGAMIVVLVGGFALWSGLAPIGGAVIAPGKLELASSRQQIQHENGGRVAELNVVEGMRVAKDDLILRFNGDERQATLTVSTTKLAELIARHARLSAERDGLAQVDGPPSPSLSVQQNLFRARREAYLQSVAQIEFQQAQSQSQIEGLDAQGRSVMRQIELAAENLAIQNELNARGLTQSDRVRTLEASLAQLQGRQGEIASSRAIALSRTAELGLTILGLQTARHERAMSELGDVSAAISELTAQIRVLSVQIERLDIRAPSDGYVHNLQVHAEGAVVLRGQAIFDFVPDNAPLVAVARVSPQNIEDVNLTKTVRLQTAAFDRATSQELVGHVTKVSADVLTAPDTGETYYRIEIALPRDAATAQTYIPGMPLTAFIETQSRTPLQYLVEPLAVYFGRAFRES